MVLASHVFILPFACEKELAKNKFNQRSEKMQKQRKTFKQEQIIIKIINQSQGVLVPPQRL